MKIREVLYRIKWIDDKGKYHYGKCLPYLMVKHCAYLGNCITGTKNYFVEKIEIPEDINEALIVTTESPL